MRKTTPVNTVLEALEMFQQGTTTTEVRTPISLQSVRKRFLDAKEAGKRVLIENSDLSSANSVVVDIDYVGSRWCLGYQKVLYFGEEVRIPHTIHFCDVYGAYGNEAQRSKRQVKIIFEGENPFE